jgi:hypothetical protein
MNPLETAVRKIHQGTLERLGEKYQERIYTGHGNFEFGERLYLIGPESFSFDHPPTTVLGCLLECTIALRASSLIRDEDHDKV